MRYQKQELEQMNSVAAKIGAFCKRNIMPLVMLAVILVLIVAFIPQFFSALNIANVARQSSITGIIAVRMTFVILTGGIDLSVGGTLAVAGIIFSGMARAGYEVFACVLCALLGYSLDKVTNVPTTLVDINNLDVSEEYAKWALSIEPNFS